MFVCKCDLMLWLRSQFCFTIVYLYCMVAVCQPVIKLMIDWLIDWTFCLPTTALGRRQSPDCSWVSEHCKLRGWLSMSVWHLHWKSFVKQWLHLKHSDFTLLTAGHTLCADNTFTILAETSHSDALLIDSSLCKLVTVKRRCQWRWLLGDVAVSLYDASGRDVAIETVDNGNNTFEVMLVAESVGHITASVFFADVEIARSPFDIDVEAHLPVQLITLHQPHTGQSLSLTVCVYICLFVPRVGPGHPSSPLSIFSPFSLFTFFHWLYLFSSFVHPFPFYQNSPTPFPGQRS